MRVLVVNAGSSSLKLTLLDGEDATIAARELEAPPRRSGHE
jgi:acetate kinase